MQAAEIENVLKYCLTNKTCRNKDRSVFLAACETLTFETLAQALSSSQLTGLFINALDDLELISQHVAAIKAQLQSEIIIRNRFNASLLNELARLCDMKPRNVRPIVLGGPSLWSTIYQEKSERHSEDLDLLFFSAEDFSSVALVATDLGYSHMKSDTLAINTQNSLSQPFSLSSSLYYVERELVLDKQEASAYRQLLGHDLNRYCITETNPGQFVVTHFLELHKLSPANCQSRFSANRLRYIRESRLSEHLYELDTAAQLVFIALKYRDKIENDSFCERADSKRLKLFGDFIRVVDSASGEQIVCAKLIAQRCGLSNELADLLACALRMHSSLPIEAVENVVARPDNNIITNAIGSCSLMLTNTMSHRERRSTMAGLRL